MPRKKPAPDPEAVQRFEAALRKALGTPPEEPRKKAKTKEAAKRRSKRTP